MNERPILFSGEMVMAILECRKTQTRRVIKPQPGILMENVLKYNRQEWPCPYGLPGDRLWVRETWQPNPEAGMDYPEVSIPSESVCYAAELSSEDYQEDKPWKSGRFMPRWASRIALEIVKIRVERVQDISEVDAAFEGCAAFHIVFGNGPSHRDTFMELWNSINAKRGYGWAVNPWVWVIEFKHWTVSPGTPGRL